MRLARAAMLEQDHHPELRLREKGTNGICAGVCTAREDGPSKYPSTQGSEEGEIAETSAIDQQQQQLTVTSHQLSKISSQEQM
ncbi:unnamed protein product [Angiostrongylus costaricensis]|uniref:Uncharacterized protein n=1 Tax=Angiostrongylus costaricensis TaxID=334426 RepID=A0A0R3PNV7_ANGCS|nr:unnamed protein product [Angiostrongylus costaricensis]